MRSALCLLVAPLRRGLPLATSRLYIPAMPFPTMPDLAAERAHEQARRHPERETLELATAGAAKVLGSDDGVTKALARAAITMDKVDLWHARLAVKMLRRDQREAIAVAGGKTRRKIGTRIGTGRSITGRYRVG